MTNPIQTYINAPKVGRAQPRPNEAMFMTKLVKFILRLK